MQGRIVAWFVGVAVVVALLGLVPSAVASNAGPPSAPWGLMVLPVYDPLTSQTTILLSWQPPLEDGGAAVTEYRVYRSVFPNTTAALVGVASEPAFTDLPFAQAGLMPDVYEYAVTAANTHGESAPSSSAYGGSFSMDGPPCVQTELEPPYVTIHPNCVDGRIIGVPPIGSCPVFRVYYTSCQERG